MIGARFVSEQKPVRIIRSNDNKAYVFICLYGKPGTYIPEGYENEDLKEENYIEYEYNEFVVDVDKVDLKDIEDHPEKYLNYPLPEVTELEQLRADVDYLLMLEG